MALLKHLEGPDFLSEYRANPDRYLPLTDDQYKYFDEWEDEIVRNLCWSAGLLEENRPYFAEFWRVFGTTNMTITVSLMNTDPAEVIQMIQKSGLIECINSDKARINLKKITDDRGNDFVGVNTVIGVSGDEKLAIPGKVGFRMFQKQPFDGIKVGDAIEQGLLHGFGVGLVIHEDSSL